ncbi:hypothetical protein [Micromonospora eburnea]|uniref:Uncharacterized protein n=1 Tax=Micromonospora eburnea TaxID=227316 RepID=A0A1C6TSM4_9ACTN|nr:hypothetical protein [Micromonospora eburnea]SCL44643.1 hypothetical protein GA0070604_0512 [Micromonospora eburnea]
MIDFVKRRMVPLLIALLVIGGGTAAVAGISQAKAKSGPVFGMPYFLYKKNANIAGPCGKNSFVRTAGTVRLQPNRHYETKKLASRFDGNVTSKEIYDYRGFSSAYRMLHCENHRYVYRYYGKTQVHREYVCTNHENEGGWIRIGCVFTSGWKSGWRTNL